MENTIKRKKQKMSFYKAYFVIQNLSFTWPNATNVIYRWDGNLERNHENISKKELKK